MEKLKQQFDSMNLQQKKQFIANLKKKVETDERFKPLLSSCIKQYNEEFRANGSASAQPSTARQSAPQQSAVDISDNNNDISESVNSYRYTPNKGLIFGIGGGVLAVIVIIFIIFSFANSGNIIGTWSSDSGSTTYTFNPNGTFSYDFSSYSSILGGNQYLRYRGSYSISGNKLTINIDLDTIRGGGTTGIKAMELLDLESVYKIKFSKNLLLLSNTDGNVIQYSR